MSSRVFPYFAIWPVLLLAQDKTSPEPVKPEPKPDQRTELNLLGKVDTASGESRRNENIQFNLIDNNALKELNIRLGTSATIVEEFRPERSYFGVEFGNPPAASLHVAASKASGFHGSLYETHNNSVFSARSFFQAGAVLPARQNDYGFDAGAGLWKRSFAAVNASQQKIRGSVNGNILIPRPEERTALATDPATRRLVERFMAAFPAAAPNRTDISPRALNTNAPQAINTDNLGGRIDQLFGTRDRLTLRYGLTSQQVDAFQLLAGQNPDTTTKSHSGRLTWERSWSASTTADVSLGFDRVHSLLVGEPNAVGPSVSFSSVISDLGPTSTLPIDRVQNRFRYAAQARMVRGHHTWSFGAEISRMQINGRETSSNRGVISFRSEFGRDALTNFRLGTPSRFSTGLGDLNRGFRSWEQQYHAGDNWRVSSRLSLNYGLRYQPVTAPYEVNGRTVIPNRCECNNLAPRFGGAWRLPGRWGVLRAAYGWQYGEIFPVTFQQLRWDPPNFQKIEAQAPYLPDPLQNAERGPTARATLFLVPPGLRSPYSQQYNFSWEASPAGSWKLQLGYVGSRTQKLFMMWFTNRALAVDDPAQQITNTINLRRPDARYFEVRRVENGSRAYFDAARISVILPDRRGLSVDTAYWFSKTIDLGAAYTNTAAGDDAKQGRSQSEGLVSEDLKGPAAFDQKHSFLARISYRLPALDRAPAGMRKAFGRWSVAAVFLAKTGSPFSVFSGSDGPGFGNVDGSAGDRPNLVDPSVLGRAIEHPDTSAKLLPKSAFHFILPTDSRGNLGLNTFRRGGIRNLNVFLSRTWTLAPEKSLTLRAESINFLNTPQFAEPTTDLTSPNFGQITNTLNDGRTFQFQLRFRF
ncbi:MAG TPA: hypothetical protein VL285_13750 [Bryobacteraceae bacterium]|jgi:hypothetical protein|nr:hypothetical protein [Bryobacteraceae bacterium]